MSISRDLGIAPTAGAHRCVGAIPRSRPTKPHGKDLRKGRISITLQSYLITTVTQNRQPVFSDFHNARLLIQILRAEQTLGRANTLAFVVMPDHLHWLLQLNAAVSLAKILQSVKGLSAKRIGSPIWQAGFHDHALRQEEDLQAVARYVIANPLRAGLVERIGDYPHWDAIWF